MGYDGLGQTTHRDEFENVEIRGIAGEESAFGTDLVDLLEDDPLGFFVLDDGLDDQAGTCGSFADRLCGRDARGDAGNGGRVDQATLGKRGEVGRDDGGRLLKSGSSPGPQGHVVPGGGEHLGQTRPHRACTEYGDFVHAR
jgi:hypothetical protein